MPYVCEGPKGSCQLIFLQSLTSPWSSSPSQLSWPGAGAFQALLRSQRVIFCRDRKICILWPSNEELNFVFEDYIYTWKCTFLKEQSKCEKRNSLHLYDKIIAPKTSFDSNNFGMEGVYGLSTSNYGKQACLFQVFRFSIKMPNTLVVIEQSLFLWKILF